ncbi:MAG: ATP-binding protein [Anaerolineae bacterium]|nr:ATP-binding protein [Anaerolineae bacterium]
MTQINRNSNNISFRFQQARYSEQILPMYQGYPTIEALPPILSEEQAVKKLANLPQFYPELRELSAELRFHAIQDIENLFVPLFKHTELEQRISRVIRSGYRGRNPMDYGYWVQLNGRNQALNIEQPPPHPTNGRSGKGLTLLGVSGIGKTTTLTRILSLYPQIIFHNWYQERELSLTQLVWLKLDCPKDGSIKSICLNFFHAIDDLLDTDYYKYYARKGRATEAEMVPKMARVASLHQLGALFIDELQRLSEAKSGGAARMLNFFVQLDNIIGVPIVLVGTFKARKFLVGEFRQARRSTGQGNPEWLRLEEDDEWDILLQALWKYQYVRNPQKLTPELSRILYDETQGITDFAVKIFMLAQIRAIESGIEMITSDIIRSVAAESLVLARDALEALRNNDWTKLQEIGDIYPMKTDSFIERAMASKRAKDEERRKRNEPASSENKKKRRQSKPKSDKREQLANRDRVERHDDLRNSLRDDNDDTYQALDNNNHIRSGDEFLD